MRPVVCVLLLVACLETLHSAAGGTPALSGEEEVSKEGVTDQCKEKKEKPKDCDDKVNVSNSDDPSGEKGKSSRGSSKVSVLPGTSDDTTTSTKEPSVSLGEQEGSGSAAGNSGPQGGKCDTSVQEDPKCSEIPEKVQKSVDPERHSGAVDHRLTSQEGREADQGRDSGTVTGGLITDSDENLRKVTPVVDSQIPTTVEQDRTGLVGVHLHGKNIDLAHSKQGGNPNTGNGGSTHISEVKPSLPKAGQGPLTSVDVPLPLSAGGETRLPKNTAAQSDLKKEMNALKEKSSPVRKEADAMFTKGAQLPTVSTGDTKTTILPSLSAATTHNSTKSTVPPTGADSNADTSPTKDMIEVIASPNDHKKTSTAPSHTPSQTLLTVSNALPMVHSLEKTDGILCSTSLFALAALATLAVVAAAPAH